jgi:hypothetical protein
VVSVIAGRETCMNLFKRVIGNAQGGENFVAGGFAAPFFLDVTPSKEASQGECEDQAGGEALPEDDAAAVLIEAATIARVENPLFQARRRGPAQEGFVKFAFKLGFKHWIRLLPGWFPS